MEVIAVYIATIRVPSETRKDTSYLITGFDPVDKQINLE